MRNISEPELLVRQARELYALLAVLARNHCLRDPIAGNCETLQFTHPQIHALLSLGQDGPLTMGVLARRVGVTEKTVTGVVDRLEREGYLQRERDGADRRVVRVRLTPKGTESHDRIKEEVHGRFAKFLAVLLPGERRELFKILRNLEARMKPANESADNKTPEPRP